MQRAVLFAAAAALTMTAPAFAGVGAKHKTAEKPPQVAASARITEVTFDLSSEPRSTINPVLPEPASVYAAPNEVKIEEYSFKLN